ncbi:MAG: UTP--glucose-1-phosphate uridylyltransferase [Myxococcota bacterium]
MPGNLRQAFRDAGQEHVFAFWEDLDSAGRQRLLAQTTRLAPTLADLVAAQSVAIAGLADKPPARKLEPAPVIELPEHGGDPAVRESARSRGEAMLSEGRVAAFVVAGGQGTRLGFDGPKGAYPVGPISDRCLFEIHAQKIRGLARRHGAVVPWYVMTSAATDAATRALFEEHACFGLDPGDVFIFAQDMVPAFDFDGRLVLESRDRIFESPNGHGGSLTALVSSGALDDMERRGVDTLSYFQVDNPLVQVGDPVYLGLHEAQGAEMSCKVLRKPDPDVKWGVVVLVDGVTAIVEYTELDDELRNARDAGGKLVYWAGSPAIHLLATDFVRRIAGDADRWLPYHASAKKIPCVDARGEPVRPDEPNGYKLERFVFDALPAARQTCLVETRASEEFSPIKNAEGPESPSSARRDLVAEYRRWLSEAGIEPPPEDQRIEIDHSQIDGPGDAATSGLSRYDQAPSIIRVQAGTAP